MGESRVDGFSLTIKVSILRNCYLQHINFLFLSDIYLVIESAVIPFHALEKHGEIKALSVLMSRLCSLGP